MSYWSGLQNFIESEYFNLTVRKELEKVFSVIPSYKYDVAYRKVIEEEIEENTKTFLRDHSHQYFDEEQIDEIKEKTRKDLNTFEVHLKALKRSGAQYMVYGYALWDEKSEYPMYRNMSLYLCDLKTKEELIYIHSDSVTKREEIYSELVRYFPKAIVN